MSESNRTIEIQVGPISRKMEVPEGVKTVGELRAKLGRFNVTDQHTAYVRSDGVGQASEASNDQEISDGMKFEFSRNSGQKG